MAEPRKPLEKLKPRHHTMAALVAAGVQDKEIARRLGVHVNAVYNAKKSPLFQTEVRRLTNNNVEEISRNYVDQVLDDGERNVRFLKKVRDGTLADMYHCEPVDRVRMRLDASKTLFDRQMPKKRDGEQQAPSINIVLNKSEQYVMKESLRDVGIAIPQLDDLIGQYDDQEADALQTGSARS